MRKKSNVKLEVDSFVTDKSMEKYSSENESIKSLVDNDEKFVKRGLKYIDLYSPNGKSKLRV